MNQVFLNPIIVAIDKNSETEAYELSKELRDHIGAIKLGLEYFDTYGPEGIKKNTKFRYSNFFGFKNPRYSTNCKKNY